MSSYENSSLAEIEAILDGLDEATAEQIFAATVNFAARAIAAVAASRADAAGGGGTPAGADGQFQVNDSGAFGASADVALAGSPGEPIILLGGTENGHATVRGGAPGVEVVIEGGDGDASHAGGEVQILGGGSSGFNGGEVQIVAGDDAADGMGGAITIQSGFSAAGDGGDVTIRAHPAFAAGDDGGNVVITAGAGGDDGGSVTIQPGMPDGSVQIFNADGSLGLSLNNTRLSLPEAVSAANLPTANPGVAGRVWNDAGTLKVSAG